jgi:hypothetical protein
MFEQVSQSNNTLKHFQYIGELSATILQSPSFCLSSLAMFENYLVFTSIGIIYLLDINTFIAAPTWINPMQIRSQNLSEIIYEYSNGMYANIGDITEIIFEDRCMQSIILSVHTRFMGTLMFKINKYPFRNNIWMNTPIKPFIIPSADLSLKRKYNQINHLENPKLSQKLSEEGLSIIQDGRLLHNYYEYDYNLSFSASNTQALAMVIRRQLLPKFGYYILRIYNLMTHADSIVYRDYVIRNVKE